MKTIVYCLILLVAGIGPVYAQAQQPWAISASAGYGLDLGQLSSNPNPYPLRIPNAQGGSEVALGAPLSLQLGLHIPFGKSLGLETGVGFISRSIGYTTQFASPSSDQCVECKAGIGIRMYRLPVLLDWAPLRGEDDKWSLHVKAGLAADWTGIPDDVFYSQGPSSLESASKVEVFDMAEGTSYMFLITDDTYSASALAGLEWEQNLGSVGRLRLGLTFSHQLASSTSLLIWGYNRDLDNRIGGYFPNILQFTSLMLQARYLFVW